MTRFIVATVFEGVGSLPDASVDLVLSSPPFLALRSYLPADHPTKGREIGSEATPADFLDTLLDVVESCDRVLAPHGSLVFELGDIYAGSGGAGVGYGPNGLREGQPGCDGRARRAGNRVTLADGRTIQPNGIGNGASRKGAGWPLDKSLTFMPQLFGASLAYGRNLLRPERTTERWRIRNVVAWCRPNPPVGALGDKFRPATSYLTVATKSRTRYFDLDAVRGPAVDPVVVKVGQASASRGISGGDSGNPDKERLSANPAGAPPLDWWEIPTQPYKGSHYATWPEDLLVRPIKAMCPERVCRTCGEPSRRIVDLAPSGIAPEARAVRHFQLGAGPTGTRHQEARTATTLGWTTCGHDDYRRGVVLDPFAGSGTTLAVAQGHGRDAVGIDLDARNADLARERAGMFLTVENRPHVTR